MLKPKCKLCGALHYAHEPHVFEGKRAVASVRAPRPRSVTAAVTKPLREPSQAPETVTPPRNAVMMVRIEELEAEVKQLKRALAEANAKLDPATATRPMTAAERMRRWREKRKSV